jgi:hypothetical protein
MVTDEFKTLFKKLVNSAELEGILASGKKKKGSNKDCEKLYSFPLFSKNGYNMALMHTKDNYFIHVGYENGKTLMMFESEKTYDCIKGTSYSYTFLALPGLPDIIKSEFFVPKHEFSYNIFEERLSEIMPENYACEFSEHARKSNWIKSFV